MAATLTAKRPQQQTAKQTELQRARAVARECLRGWHQKAHWDPKAMARMDELMAANPWLDE